MEREMGEALKPVLRMNGGSGKLSYAENSSIQNLIIQKSQHILRESIRDLLLCQHSSGLPKCLNVADLGCSSGSNAFFAVKEIIKSIYRTCREEKYNCPPSIQIFLNDLIGNDFNTLFKMLPRFYDEMGKIINNTSCCYTAAVPGSFYGRLFPDHTIHFLHSSSSLHWLSQVPFGLVNNSAEPLNKRNICVTKTSPPSVYKAYMNQFENDFTTFLRMRSQEVVPKGHLVLTFVCMNDEDDGPSFLEILGDTLQDMISMGVIEERQFANFNVPIYTSSIEELEQIIKAEGSFTVRRLETFKLKLDSTYMDKGENRGRCVAMCIRAILESLLANHFGENCMNDLFEMYAQNMLKYMEKEKGIVNNVTLLLVKETK